MQLIPARILIATALSAGAATAFSQGAGDYPSRPVRLVVAQAAGGGLDQTARLIATRMTESLGQTVVIENRPSAGGIAGMEGVARAPADGYTLLMASATVALNTALGMKLPYDPERDFAPISLAVSVPMMFVVHPATPYKTLTDIVEDSKRQANGVAFAIASVGTLPHLLAETLRYKTRANLNLIFYKGAAPASLDALAGTVPAFIDGISPVGTHVAAGKLRAVALASRARSPLFPDVPTTAEAGYPDLVGSAFFGVLAPARTPPAIQRRLHQSVVDALGRPDLRERFLKLGYEIHASTPEEYAAFMKSEIARWAPIAKAAGIKVD